MSGMPGNGFRGTRIVVARYPGTCRRCDKDFKPGEQITWWLEGWCHIGCHPKWEYTKVSAQPPLKTDLNVCAFCKKSIGVGYKGEMTQWGRVHWKCFSTWNKEENTFESLHVKKRGGEKKEDGPKLWECWECGTKIEKSGLCQPCNLAQWA